MELHQTKCPPSEGDHQQNEKAAYGMGECICQSYIWLKVNTENI